MAQSNGTFSFSAEEHALIARLAKERDMPKSKVLAAGLWLLADQAPPKVGSKALREPALTKQEQVLLGLVGEEPDYPLSEHELLRATGYGKAHLRRSMLTLVRLGKAHDRGLAGEYVWGQERIGRWYSTISLVDANQALETDYNDGERDCWRKLENVERFLRAVGEYVKGAENENVVEYWASRARRAQLGYEQAKWYPDPDKAREEWKANWTEWKFQNWSMQMREIRAAQRR